MFVSYFGKCIARTALRGGGGGILDTDKSGAHLIKGMNKKGFDTKLWAFKSIQTQATQTHAAQTLLVEAGLCCVFVSIQMRLQIGSRNRLQRNKCRGKARYGCDYK